MKLFSNNGLKIIATVALLAALTIQPFAPVKATTNTPVFVLGVSNPADPLIVDLQGLTTSVTILNSVTGLTGISTNSILYIDGSWLATASSLNPTLIPTIIQTVVSGVPTIVVRGDPSTLANSVSGLMKYQNPGLPLISEGVHVISTLSDGTRQAALLRVASGFDYAVATEFQWANQQVTATTGTIGQLTLAQPNAKQSTPTRVITTSSSTGPFWQFILLATTDTGTNFQPYGQVITTFTVFRLQNSASTNFKWYNVFSNQTMIPGIQIYTNSSYRNYQETAFSQPNDQNNVYVSNGPPSQSPSGASTISYSIGTPEATQTMSYFTKNANITNTSNASNVGWTSTMNGGTAVGKLTLQVIPGWTDQVVQNHSLNLQGNVTVTFATFTSSNPTNTHLTGIAFGLGGN